MIAGNYQLLVLHTDIDVFHPVFRPLYASVHLVQALIFAFPGDWIHPACHLQFQIGSGFSG